MDDHPSLTLDDLRARLSAAIAAQTPFSIIRLGDGEGWVMGYPEHVSASQLGGIWRTWFGHSDYRHTQVAALRGALRAACGAADIVGIPEVEPDLASDFGRVAALLARDEWLGPGMSLCHSGFHLWFERYGWYDGLLAGLPEIGVIGPRDLTRVLSEMFGIGRVHWLPTPPEMRFADLPEAEIAALARHDAHLATRCPELLDHDIPRLMRQRPGLVVLVGAGILGKLYCGRVKAMGGVAIDLGSMMDLWAGLKTRENPVFVDLRTPQGSEPVPTQPLDFDKASPAHRGFIADVLRRHDLDEARFCRPLPREDATFFKVLLPACGGDRSLALFRFTEAAVREAEICRQIVEGAFGGMEAVGSVLHVAAGWGRLTRALVQRLPAGRLFVSDDRADAVAWQARMFGTIGVDWPPPGQGPRHDMIAVGPLGAGGTAEAWLEARLERLHALLAPGGVLTFGLPAGAETWVEAAVRRLRPDAPPTWCRLPSAGRGEDDRYLVGGPARDVTVLPVVLPPTGGFERATRLADGEVAFAGWAVAPGDRIERLTVHVEGCPEAGPCPLVEPAAPGEAVIPVGMDADRWPASLRPADDRRPAVAGAIGDELSSSPIGISWRFSLPAATPPDATVRLRIESRSRRVGACYAKASGQVLT